MKKRILSIAAASLMTLGLLASCGKKQQTWTVTCPWAPSGVASMVSQKAAAMSTDKSEDLILVAEAVKGDAATVNTWVATTKADDPKLVFAGEGLFSITSILDPQKMQFSYDDFEYVENLYSSIFVVSAQADLNIKNVDDLKAFVADAGEITVATNGATSSEAFLAAALFDSVGGGDKIKITPYASAAEAAQAVSRGETQFGVSHQSQILEAFQQGGVTVVCAFDKDDIAEGPFKGVEGVGKYNIPYFRNRCLIFARKGTKAESVEKLRKLYDDILADKTMADWMHNTMLIEVDPMSAEQVNEHLENVRNIVNEYKDIVMR